MPLTSLLLTLAMLSVPVATDEPGAIATLDAPRFQVPKEKGSAEQVEGKLGKATRFRFEKDAPSTFFTGNIHGTPAWDEAAGFSFWVKGEGIDGFGGLQFIYDEDYAVRYDFCFPVKGSEWTKVIVAWGDLISVLPGPRAKPLGAPDGNPPSKLSGLWIGKWWYWGHYPAIAFAIDDIRLETSIPRDRVDDRPDGPPLARVHARLRAGKPITVVTMGDSLTDRRHWANRERNWPELLRAGLKDKYRSEIRVVNPAIGGTQLKQNLVLMPTWLDSAPEPDLVTVFFGGNDWDAGMRGEEFERTCEDAIDRVRRATRGKADVLILTTNPSAVRWDATSELAEACRKAARSRNAGLADTERAFHEAGKVDRGRLFVVDKVHLGPIGHGLVADEVMRAIESIGH